ncbi:MAG: alpha/beta hydrolase [Pseudomonadota bacterium]
MRTAFAALSATVLLAACGGGAPSEPKDVRAPTAEEVAKAEAFLAENNTPLPEGWAFSKIPFGEGEHLRIGHAPAEAPKGTIIFVPGYTSSPELASDFLAKWAEMGFEVASLDLPGQGGSVRRNDDYQKPYTGDFSVFGKSVAAAATYIDSVRKSDGPLIVAGDSFGGHSILRGAADTGLPEADGLFVLVPAVEPELDAPKFLVKWFIGSAVSNGKGAQYMDGMGQWSADDYAAYDYSRCGNREDRNFKNAALYMTKPELRVGGPTNEWGLGMVTSGENLMKSKALRNFDRPVQMVTAGLDVIVKNAPAEKLCTRRMGSCELTRIEEATHCVYLEDEPTQAKVHDALLTLSRRLSNDT